MRVRVRDPNTPAVVASGAVSATIPDDQSLSMGSLTEALESPEKAPPKGAKPAIEQLQGVQDRTLNNRARLQDRYHQLPLYGKARAKADGGKAAWMKDGMPSDHPLVQMILSLRIDEEELVAKEDGEYVIEMEAKDRLKLKLAVKAKMSDLLLALQKESGQIYDEVMQIISHDQRQKEHSDKMSVARNLKEEELSDEELRRRAKDAGITLIGEDEK